MVFKADYDEIKLQNMVMTSFQWSHAVENYITWRYKFRIAFPGGFV